jgi:hypothetical protein
MIEKLEVNTLKDMLANRESTVELQKRSLEVKDRLIEYNEQVAEKWMHIARISMTVNLLLIVVIISIFVFR